MYEIAFLVSEFPSVSQIFIQNQIIAVIECGHEVGIFAGIERKDLKLNQELDRYRLLERTVYPQIPHNKFIRVAKALKLIGWFFPQNPWAILKSLNFVKYGRRAFSLTLLYELIPFLESGHFDIIHCQFGDLGLQGLCLKQIMGDRPKLVTSFRGYDAFLNVHGKSGGYDELFREGELFLPVSCSLKKRIVAQGCLTDKVVVLPSGINLKKLTYSERGIVQNEPIKVITVGRLVEKKGITYGIEAIAQVVGTGRNVTYDVIGDGELRDDLEQLIVERGMQMHIRLLGRRTHEEVLQTLQESHILIAPSITASNGDQEGIPNVIKEAMAVGLPVISTLHSGIPELVENGVSGFLVPERDVDALTDRISYLIDHPEVWVNIGRLDVLVLKLNMTLLP